MYARTLVLTVCNELGIQAPRSMPDDCKLLQSVREVIDDAVAEDMHGRRLEIAAQILAGWAVPVDKDLPLAAHGALVVADALIKEAENG